MSAELAEQPAVLGRLADRHPADRDRVRAALPPGHAGTVLLARRSAPHLAALAAPSLHPRHQADVDYRGYLAVALSQSGATPEVVQTAAAMRRAGAVVVGITNEGGSPLDRKST